MQEFLVQIIVTIPESAEPAEVDRRRAAETLRAEELAVSGNLARLWRPVGGQGNVGIWRADDEDDLMRNVLGTLPLRDWMTITVTALGPHPGDPGGKA